MLKLTDKRKNSGFVAVEDVSVGTVVELRGSLCLVAEDYVIALDSMQVLCEGDDFNWGEMCFPLEAELIIQNPDK